MSNINDLAYKLGIDNKIEEKDTGVYYTWLDSSDEFNDLFSVLSSSSDFEQDIDEFWIEEDKTHLVFYNYEYSIEMSADFGEDSYIVYFYEAE